MDTVGKEAGKMSVPVGTVKVVDVEFLEVDMSPERASGCGACDSARGRLRAAIETAEPVLEELGVQVRIRDVLVETEEQARILAFKASPTIKVGGIELVPEHRAPEGDQAAEGGEDRAWLWRGEEHALPPKAMILDAILRAYAVLDGEVHEPAASAGRYEVPPYVRRFLGTGASGRAAAPTEGPACGCG
jgi:hypothetical protein